MRKFVFLIQTHSRVTFTKNLIYQLKDFLDYGRIVVSNNGNNSEEEFLIDDIPVEYLDNSKYPSGHDHFKSILKQGYKNLFILHDDDHIVKENFRRALISLSSSDFEYAVSMKKKSSKSKEYKSYSEIFIDYFLIDNHPIISGQFISNPANFLDKAPDKVKFYMENGKYDDVIKVSWSLLNLNSKCFNENYITSIIHNDNDSLYKCLKSRLYLRDFIYKQGGLTNVIISGLVGYGYKEMRFRLYMSWFLLPLKPKLLFLYTRKAAAKLKFRQ